MKLKKNAVKRDIIKKNKYKRVLMSFVVFVCVGSQVMTVAAGKEEDNKRQMEYGLSLPIQTNAVEGWPEGPEVTAEAAIVMEVKTGAVLYEKDINKKHYPASITKIMTTLLALENNKLDETVTFSKDSIWDIDRNSSHIAMDVGQTLTLEESLYAVMLESANEVAYAVAEHTGGSFEKFVNQMNEKAKEIGCLNTNFTNPHGLQEEEHYTTAYDMALIARAALENEEFRKITGSISYVIPETENHLKKELYNHHRMLRRTSYNYEGCFGGKTGGTTEALNTLVTFAKSGETELICVTLKTPTVDKAGSPLYPDTKALLDYGFGNFKKAEIKQDDQQLEKIRKIALQTDKDIWDPSKYRVLGENKDFVMIPNNVDLDMFQLTGNYEEDGNTPLLTVEYTYQDRKLGKSVLTVTPLAQSSKVILEEPETEETDGKKTTNRKYIYLVIILFFLIVFVVAILRTRAQQRRLQRERMRRRRRKNNSNRRQQ